MIIPANDYDLDATLNSGQVFRWRRDPDHWTGVLGHHRFQLSQRGTELLAKAETPSPDWRRLERFLQVHVNLEDVLQTFPADPPMDAAVAFCRGLRLLRQDPWECLASFILSSTKQIVQIQQVVSALCERFGDFIGAEAPGHKVSLTHAFPSADSLAARSEADLRGCRMGFRAPYLLETARTVASRQLDLQSLEHLPADHARAALMALPGVGRKVADCVLLFAYGFPTAFPVDVWIMRALKDLYFPRSRKINFSKLLEFSEMHFGPHAGYAQQYLFHYVRTRKKHETT